MQINKHLVFRTKALLLVVAMVCAACSGAPAQESAPGGGGDQASGAEEVIDVTLALSSLTVLLSLPLVAQDAGFFESNGLNVDEVVANSAADAITITLSGDADFVTTAAPAVFALNAEGQPMQFLANAYSGLAGSVVMSESAAQASGVSPDDPVEDRLMALNGLSMAFASPSSGYLAVMRRALELVGAQVEPIYIEQASMPTALAQGDIDVLIASPPVSEVAVQDGGVLWISGPNNELPEEVQPPITTAVAAMEPFLQENPEAAERFMAALAEAADLIENDPEAARDAIRERFADIDDELFNQSWEANQAAFSDIGLSAELLERQRSQLTEEEATPAVMDLNVEDLLADEFVVAPTS